MKQSQLRILRIIIAITCFVGGGLFLFFNFNIIAFLSISTLLVLINYDNFLKFTYNLEHILYFLSVVFIGVFMDRISVYPIYSISMMLLFPSMGSIRNNFPFLIGINKYPYFEKLFWIFSALVYSTALYLNTWQWAYLAYFTPCFGIATIYTWYHRAKELQAYITHGTKPVVLQIGSKAIDFNLPDTSGNIVQLKSFENKASVLLLFIRGDWCPACHIMIRTFFKFKEKFKEKGIHLIAIGPDPYKINMEMLERLGVEFTLLSDEKLKTTQLYGAKGDGQFVHYAFNGLALPAAFFIDKCGIIRYIVHPDSPEILLSPDSILNAIEGIAQSSHSEHFQETYETLVNQANEGIMVVDIVNGSILFSNQFMANLLGYSIQNILSKTIFDFYPQEHLSENAKQIADAWENKGAVFKSNFLHQNQDEIITECSAKVIHYGKVAALVLYIRDIRERIRLESKILEQLRIIEHKNKEIVDSITYTQRLQNSSLPSEGAVQQVFPESFVLYLPKDIIAGDFYFCDMVNTNNGTPLKAIAIGDCTGHGVPGAFLSILLLAYLKQSLTEQSVESPANALEYLSKKIRKVLEYKNENKETIKDSADMVFMTIDTKTHTLIAACANNPIYIIRNNQLIEIAAQKRTVGYSDNEEACTNQSFTLQKGDCIFLFSDGFADQFGTPEKHTQKDKKFTKKRLKELLISISTHSSQQQKEALFAAHLHWKKELEQTDDICIIGIRY